MSVDFSEPSSQSGFQPGPPAIGPWIWLKPQEFQPGFWFVWLAHVWSRFGKATEMRLPPTLLRSAGAMVEHEISEYGLPDSSPVKYSTSIAP